MKTQNMSIYSKVSELSEISKVLLLPLWPLGPKGGTFTSNRVIEILGALLP